MLSHMVDSFIIAEKQNDAIAELLELNIYFIYLFY